MNSHPSTSSGQAHMAENKVTLGFWVYLMSDCVLFAGLFATYAVLRGATFGGPTAYDLVNLPFVLTETMLLLTSSFTIGLAVIFATRAEKSRRSGPLGQVLPTFLALVATFILGAAFLAMEVYEFRHLILAGEGPGTSAFLSAFFTLIGTHGLHVFFGSLWMLVVMAHIWFRGLSGNITKLICLSLFWHFLDVIWIFIFTFVYLLGAVA